LHNLTSRSIGVYYFKNSMGHVHNTASFRLSSLSSRKSSNRWGISAAVAEQVSAIVELSADNGDQLTVDLTVV